MDISIIKVLAVVVVGALAACARVPTPATITTIGDDGLRYCSPDLGMTVRELVDECGKPARIVPWAGRGPDDRCLLYESAAMAFQGAPAATAVAVCVGKEFPRSDNIVQAVYGLTTTDNSRVHEGP